MGLINFINSKLSDDSDGWRPRLTRDTIKFATRDPEPSKSNRNINSVLEARLTLLLDPSFTIEAVCKAVGRAYFVHKNFLDSFSTLRNVLLGTTPV